MAIPEVQLARWANPGSTSSPERTYASVKYALDTYGRWPEGINYDVYLQGSYPNHTGVRVDSDVDVVVQLNTTFQFDSHLLNETERGLLAAIIHPVTYPWREFRADVLGALRKHLSVGSVREARNCLEVLPGTGTLGAHVVPAVDYRFYRSFRSSSDHTVAHGIAFWRRDGIEIQNFPKQHIANGAAKNRATNDLYKPTIRMFKNGRTRLVESHTMPEGLVPSYCIECLLYNVPSVSYTGSFREIYCNVVNYLHRADLEPFHCQNEEYLLFGSQVWQWSVESARTFITALIDLWKLWS